MLRGKVGGEPGTGAGTGSERDRSTIASVGKQTLVEHRAVVQARTSAPAAGRGLHDPAPGDRPAAGHEAVLTGRPASELNADGQPQGGLPRLQLKDIAPVQRTATGEAGHGSATPAEIARHGIESGGGQLPHFEQIQASFGRHDVSGVSAHQGSAASNASRSLGAQAYAFGNSVAFQSSPDLHTAAHEAAHVVQQRAGVQCAGGVGREGDAYERHADQVADTVVAGKSAEGLLSEMAPGRGSSDGADAVQRKPTKPQLGSGDEDFQKMWEAHPHNYQDDESQNTSSDDVRTEQGLPDYMDNTCAIRLSTMLNGTGNKITPAKAKAAGLERKPKYSKKTKHYYIIAANEMWQYLEKHFRKEDMAFPATGRYKDEAAFQAELETTIKPLVVAHKGIAAFDKIFGFGGTGHIDLFDGEHLSDAPDWYPCQKLRLWFIVVP
jgi:hypothetical protein